MGLLDFFNTRVEEEENTEGIQGRLSSLLSLSKEEELIKLKNKWISDWESFEGKKKIEELKNGKYFVYAVAFDSTWGASGARVTGGMPLKIKRSQSEDEITIHIPLSE